MYQSSEATIRNAVVVRSHHNCLLVATYEMFSFFFSSTLIRIFCEFNAHLPFKNSFNYQIYIIIVNKNTSHGHTHTWTLLWWSHFLLCPSICGSPFSFEFKLMSPHRQRETNSLCTIRMRFSRNIASRHHGSCTLVWVFVVVLRLQRFSVKHSCGREWM